MVFVYPIDGFVFLAPTAYNPIRIYHRDLARGPRRRTSRVLEVALLRPLANPGAIT